MLSQRQSKRTINLVFVYLANLEFFKFKVVVGTQPDDIYLMKVITDVELCVCVMRENNDHWFSHQARAFELLFTIFNVHKIK